jgi:nicotinamidase-related amidase
MRAGLTALLLLDLQKDFLQPTGRLPIYSQQAGSRRADRSEARAGCLHQPKAHDAAVFADACVAATATSALRKGFEVAVAADSVGAASDQARDRALSRLRSKAAYIPIQGGV